MLETINDGYNGITINPDSLPQDIAEFRKEITHLIETLSNKHLLWVKIPILKSTFIPELTQLGFEFHHCDEKNLMLVKKLHPDAFVPTTKNYIVGVGAVVFCEGQLLVVKDKFSTGYKLPGGHVDKNESIKDAVKREVYEETGIAIAFESIMNIGHFKNGQFGESNLYMVCTAKALSKDITINDASEIVEARWIHPEDFLAMEEVNDYNRSVVKAALSNKDIKLIDRKVKLRVVDGEVFF